MIKAFTITLVGIGSLISLFFNSQQPPEKPQVEKPDSTRLFYYSFTEKKVVYLKKESEKGFNEKLDVCQGAKVVLEAPTFYANAIYYWEGPEGFRSYLPKIQFDNIDQTQEGVYSVLVRNQNGLVNGKIELKVHEKPVLNLQKILEGEVARFEVLMDNNSNQYYWQNNKEEIIRRPYPLIVSQQKLNSENWVLVVKNENCENRMNL